MTIQGWICPRCDAVMSPTCPTCFYCKPKKREEHESIRTTGFARMETTEHTETLAICIHGAPVKYGCWQCHKVLFAQPRNETL